MPASFPGSAKVFTAKIDGFTRPAAADVNDLQAEVTAIEQGLLGQGTFAPALAAGAKMALGGGTGPSGQGQVPAQIEALVPLTFLSGTTLAGSDTTHAVVSGDQRSLVGYYYVATGVANNPSVPIVSATFDGTNTTFVISTVTGNTNGITYEVSLWPGGTTGRIQTGDTRPATVYKPLQLGATTVFQIGPNTALYQVDTYGTVYLIGLNGTGANLSHFRDLRLADLGCQAIENDGTYLAAGNPGGTEPGPIIEGYLGYNGAAIKLFTDPINNPRTKTFEAGGIPGLYAPFGHVGSYALAASAGTQFLDSPKHRFIGTYWTGAASADAIAYILNHVVDATGAKELQLGFEAGGAGSGTVRALALLKADKGITFATSADPGVPGVWVDGTEIFLQSYANGPIFLRTQIGNNNNALLGSAGSWVTKDSAGATRNTLDDGSGNGITALKKTIGGAVATTAGGSTTGFLSFGSAAALGIYFGSGVPTITAPQGSLYMRTDGSSASSRAYVNTTGSTVWTAITTAA